MNIWLSRYTKLLAVVTLLLIVAGGMVTSTGSGLAVPDWPLSYGQVMPPMVGGIFYEHGHRMIASLVGFMTLIFTIWCGITEKKRWLRRLSIAALGMVVAQGILGGMTVLFLLPPAISILHACIAQTFFATVVAIAYFYSREWQKSSLSADCFGTDLTVPRNDKLRSLRDATQLVSKQSKAVDCPPKSWRDSSGQISPRFVANRTSSGLAMTTWLTIALIYVQLILGATIRHTSRTLVVIPHIMGAFLVIFHTIALSIYTFKNFSEEKKLVYPVVFLGLLSIVQVSLGMGSFIYTMMLPKTIQPSISRLFFVTSHQTLGALLLGTGIFLALRVYRFEKAATI